MLRLRSVLSAVPPKRKLMSSRKSEISMTYSTVSLFVPNGWPTGSPAVAPGPAQ